MTEPRTAIEILQTCGQSKYRYEFAEIALHQCQLFGATDADLAQLFGVSLRTIAGWALRHPKFGEALKVGKAAADDRVERSLYMRAIGYSYESEKLFLPKGETEPVRAKIRVHVPADVGAAQYWLNNRRPDQWRSRKEVGIGGEKPGTPLHVATVTPEMTEADIAYLALLF